MNGLRFRIAAPNDHPINEPWDCTLQSCSSTGLDSTTRPEGSSCGYGWEARCHEGRRIPTPDAGAETSVDSSVDAPADVADDTDASDPADARDAD